MNPGVRSVRDPDPHRAGLSLAGGLAVRVRRGHRQRCDRSRRTLARLASTGPMPSAIAAAIALGIGMFMPLLGISVAVFVVVDLVVPLRATTSGTPTARETPFGSRR